MNEETQKISWKPLNWVAKFVLRIFPSLATSFVIWKTQRLMKAWGHFSQRPLLLAAHPDLCLYISRSPRISGRGLVKVGERRGFLVLQFFYLVATIRWTFGRG